MGYRKRIIKYVNEVNDNKLYHLFIFLLCILILLFSLILSFENGNSIYISGFEQYNYFGFCLFKQVTGVQCPSCGLTRSFILIGHFKILEALSFNMVGIFMYILVILQIPYRVLLISKNAKIIYTNKITLFSKVYIYLLCFILSVEWLYKLFVDVNF